MTDESIRDFSNRTLSIIRDTKKYEIEPLFYLTQHCNLRCPGCYMSASSDASRNTLPYSDLHFYLDEFAAMPNFTNCVTFSGGEIFTAPINYIEACSHIVLDHGLGLQLKTNGAWVQNPQIRNSVITMLRRLQPLHGLVASGEQIRKFLNRYPRWLLRTLGRNMVYALIAKKFSTTSALSMVVSVDDKLHPAQSADWFIKIADIIRNDKKLKKDLNLKTFSVNESVPLLESRILNNPELDIKNPQKISKHSAIKYSINGLPVESYIGEYIDTKSVPATLKLSEIVVPPLGDASGRLVYCFYPDGTVGFDCNYLESVGRVPYRDASGKCKSLPKLQSDIHARLVSDYTRAISK